VTSAVEARRPGTIGRVAWWLLIATLALLPFEYWLPQFPLGGLLFTSLEIVWGLALVAWLATLAAEKRLPHVPRAVLLALSALLVVSSASALFADALRSQALVFVGRSAAGWLFFIALADRLAVVRNLRVPLVALVATTAISAGVGILLYVAPQIAVSLNLEQFYAAGALRLSGTYNYPNTAAMAFEAVALLTVALFVLEPGGTLRRIWLICGVVIVAALLLTLSRGAAIGLAVGIVSIALFAFVIGRRRTSIRAFAGAAALIVVALVVEVTVAPAARLFTDAENGLYGATYDAHRASSAPASTAVFDVTVTNTGSLTWNTANPGEYKLGFHWLNPQTDELVADGAATADLPTLGPSQAATVTVDVGSVEATRDYEIAWDVVRNGWLWFSQRGVAVSTTRIGPSAGASAPPSSRGLSLDPDTGGVSRTQLWSVAVRMIGDSPLLGVGPGTYRLRYGTYLGLAQWDERIYSNNLYLEIASTTGLLGLAVFLVLVALVLMRPLRALVARRSVSAHGRPLNDRQWLALAAIVAAAIAFLAHGFVDYFFAFNPINGVWWATLATAITAPLILGGALAPDANTRPTEIDR
jgi:O-antigen ligase